MRYPDHDKSKCTEECIGVKPCPYDTNEDGDCGQKMCPHCAPETWERIAQGDKGAEKLKDIFGKKDNSWSGPVP